MSGTFVVYGVTRKLAHDKAVKIVADEYEREKACMNTSPKAPIEIEAKAVELYGHMKAAAISPWYSSPTLAREFIDLARKQDEGRDMSIKQRIELNGYGGTTREITERGSYKTELRDYRE